MMIRGGILGLTKCTESCQLGPLTSTFLPFLYETRTLQKYPRQLGRCHVSINATKKMFRQGLPKEATEDIAREDELAEIVRSSSLQEPPRSSLTPSERAVFERIEEDAADQQARHSRSEAGAVERLIQDSNNSIDSKESLSFTFANARPRISEAYQTRARSFLDMRQDQRDKSDLIPPELLPNYPTMSLSPHGGGREARDAKMKAMEQAASVLPVTTGTHEAPKGAKLRNAYLSPQEKELENLRAQKHQSRRIDNLLENAKSDVRIWEVLQDEVFAPVQRFAESIGSADKEKPGAPQHDDQGKLKSGSRRGKKRKQASGPLGVSSIRALNIPQGLDRDPVLAVPLTVIQANYAYHCWSAMRRLREFFPRSPYATAILPTIKSLGPMSYVLGASTELYNEALFLRWVHYRDPHACADLRAEMLGRGISSSPQTQAVFRDAARSWLRARRLERGISTPRSRTSPTPKRGGPVAGIRAKEEEEEATSPFELAWWSLEGVKSGFRRWHALETEAQERYEEDQRRQETARREAELEDGEVV
jgi:Mtf2 family